MTPADAREALETARSEAAEAHATVEALTERVREGDEHVTPEELAGQRSLADLAALRVEAAERKLTAAIDADRDARARATAAAVRELVDADDTQPLVDALRDAAAAVARLADLANARAARIRAVASDAVGINAELKDAGATGPWPSDAYGFRGQTVPASVTACGKGGRRADAVPAGRLAAVALVLGLGNDRQMEADARETLTAPTDRVIARVAGEVPGLADALTASPEEWQAASEDGRYRLAMQGRQPQPSETGAAA